jgi:hypothetical protein
MLYPWTINYKSVNSLVIKSRIKYFCPITQFTCGDRTCISILGRCDGVVDCPNDQADEQDCRTLIYFFIRMIIKLRLKFLYY